MTTDLLHRASLLLAEALDIIAVQRDQIEALQQPLTHGRPPKPTGLQYCDECGAPINPRRPSGLHRTCYYRRSKRQCRAKAKGTA